MTPGLVGTRVSRSRRPRRSTSLRSRWVSSFKSPRVPCSVGLSRTRVCRRPASAGRCASLVPSSSDGLSAALKDHARTRRSRVSRRRIGSSTRDHLMVDQLHQARPAAAQVSPFGWMACGLRFPGDPSPYPPKFAGPNVRRKPLIDRNIFSGGEVDATGFSLWRAYPPVDSSRAPQSEEPRKQSRQSP